MAIDDLTTVRLRPGSWDASRRIDEHARFRRDIVGFRPGICRVQCREIGLTRQQSHLWNQGVKCRMSGLSGFYRRREAPRNQNDGFRAKWAAHRRGLVGNFEDCEDFERTAGRGRIQLKFLQESGFWTPVGLQNAVLGGYPKRKSLRNLVGPPGFEPGTSCTPSKRASQAAPRPESLHLNATRLLGALSRANAPSSASWSPGIRGWIRAAR